MNKLSEHHTIQHLPKLQPHLHLTERAIGGIARTRHREHHIRVYVQTLCASEASRSERFTVFFSSFLHIKKHHTDIIPSTFLSGVELEQVLRCLKGSRCVNPLSMHLAQGGSTYGGAMHHLGIYHLWRNSCGNLPVRRIIRGEPLVWKSFP